LFRPDKRRVRRETFVSDSGTTRTFRDLATLFFSGETLVFSDISIGMSLAETANE